MAGRRVAAGCPYPWAVWWVVPATSWSSTRRSSASRNGPLGRGRSSHEAADRLDVSPKTVATYKARIAEKLGRKTTADHVR